MKCSLGDNTIHIFPSLLKIIGSGREGKAYKYNGRVLKIFHDTPYEESMSAETCVELQKIQTDRILLPREMLLDKYGEFKGYTTKLISRDKYVYDISKEKFISEINELEKEINILSEFSIALNDWHMRNFKYDGKFRMIDPGLYKYAYKLNINDTKKYNYIILKEFIFYELIKNRLMTEMDDYYKFLNEAFDITNDAAIFFEEEMYDGETINQYIKRIAQPNHFVI